MRSLRLRLFALGLGGMASACATLGTAPLGSADEIAAEDAAAMKEVGGKAGGTASARHLARFGNSLASDVIVVGCSDSCSASQG